MTATEKIYHIYAKDKCIFHSLKEEEFKITWGALNKLVNVLDTLYDIDDLSYEELQVNKEAILNSSH
jgi:negative regulator of replication initiation